MRSFENSHRGDHDQLWHRNGCSWNNRVFAGCFISSFCNHGRLFPEGNAYWSAKRVVNLQERFRQDGQHAKPCSHACPNKLPRSQRTSLWHNENPEGLQYSGRKFSNRLITFKNVRIPISMGMHLALCLIWFLFLHFGGFFLRKYLFIWSDDPPTYPGSTLNVLSAWSSLGGLLYICLCSVKYLWWQNEGKMNYRRQKWKKKKEWQ